MNIIIGIALLLSLGFLFYIMFKRDEKRYNEIRTKKDECSEYLETVKIRANLSVFPEGLYMLYLELVGSCEIYTYHKDTYEEYKRIAAYIAGKYHGLRKISYKTL